MDDRTERKQPLDEESREKVEIREKLKDGKLEDMPSAGPHARPELTDYDKTPGSGILPRHDEENTQPTG